MCVLDGSSTLEDWMIWDHHPMRRNYEVVMDLGEGAFSSVVLARHKQTKKLAALKVVYLLSPEMDDDHLAVMRREADFLKMLDSPCIVKCLDEVDDGRQQVIVLEYLRGGQLYDSLHRLGGSEQPYTEQAAAAIFAQMAEGLAFMHDFGIIHRDIKGENFVFVEDPAHAAAHRRAPSVKLIDLGMSVQYDPKIPVTGALGSPGFVSPEVVHDEAHTPSMDIFSLGVVAFVMLVGRKPFSIQDSENLRYCEMDIRDAPGLKDPRWLSLSPAAKDMLMGMLRYNTAHRLTAHQVLRHDWVVSRGGTVRRPLDARVVQGAANVAALRRLRNLAHGVIAVNRLSEAVDKKEAQKRNASNFAISRTAMEKGKGYRNDLSGKGISRSDRRALTATATAAARLHDSGETYPLDGDISVHFKPNKAASVHGGHAFYGDGSGSGRRRRSRTGSKEDLRMKSLKTSGSAVMLSELEMEGSYHGGMHGSQSMAVLPEARSGSLGRTSTSLVAALRSIGNRSASSVRDSDEDASGSKHGRAAASSGSNEGSHHAGRNRGPPPADSSGHGLNNTPFGASAGGGARGRDARQLSSVHRVPPLRECRESLDLTPKHPAPPTALQERI